MKSTPRYDIILCSAEERGREREKERKREKQREYGHIHSLINITFMRRGVESNMPDEVTLTGKNGAQP
jgi:hypothetical protein